MKICIGGGGGLFPDPFLVPQRYAKGRRVYSSLLGQQSKLFTVIFANQFVSRNFCTIFATLSDAILSTNPFRSQSVFTAP